MANKIQSYLHYLFKPVRGSSHQERLEHFYHKQAENYDDMRQGLLHGRKKLLDNIHIPKDCTWVDLGGGTGYLMHLLSKEQRSLIKSYHLVDLSPSMLEVAKSSLKSLDLDTNFYCEDVCHFKLRDKEKADVITFSYSLCMIPNWFSALDNASSLLAENGQLAATDFHVSRKYAEPGLINHGAWTRAFWPLFFGVNNVHPSSEHVPYLRHRFKEKYFFESRGNVPGWPFEKIPYYGFIGENKAAHY